MTGYKSKFFSEDTCDIDLHWELFNFRTSKMIGYSNFPIRINKLKSRHIKLRNMMKIDFFLDHSSKISLNWFFCSIVTINCIQYINCALILFLEDYLYTWNFKSFWNRKNWHFIFVIWNCRPNIYNF